MCEQVDMMCKLLFSTLVWTHGVSETRIGMCICEYVNIM
jgi:hypothetical protein